MKLYEGMFLVDHNKARQDFAKVQEEITGIIVKAGGEIVNLESWAERKLCYEIKRHRRGAFVLSHFRVPPEGVAKIERSCRLSEIVLRVLVTRDEDGPEIPHYSERADIEERGGEEFDGEAPRGGRREHAPRERARRPEAAEAGAAPAAGGSADLAAPAAGIRE